ncbi:MAG: hypothetical protein B1H13_14920 [Desulfobacteraceae bacterium 4484_190.3]|nr:MAG: hypothetical protein B1H13_14920 [Desulfobacteraceae bacterium 4484_190.3]
MSATLMDHLMKPRSVAIIGISRRSGPGSYNLMENMLLYGFKGKIFPINPQAREILGFQAYPNIGEVGHEVDLAVITVTGAGGIIATDALERNGLELAHLSEQTIRKAADLSPEWMPLGNPLDIWPAVMKHGM